MNTVYLKADSESALKEALSFCLSVDEEGSQFLAPKGPGWSLDVIGKILRPDFDFGDQESPNAPTEDDYVPGWHANLLVTEDFSETIPESIVISTPNNPVREWYL
ncbi:hypothetical protein [Thalassospira marina]|uniref:Uncharacterized protein n=1 Tax=Thalassospira marina TaxID=2048283 RepID=A0A2N3KY25_9PROT|nr:hypothetical protein [Thalassospira marina]PKR55413.1 hypothetical protein COO20_04380 [Thalassospira marina]